MTIRTPTGGDLVSRRRRTRFAVASAFLLILAASTAVVVRSRMKTGDLTINTDRFTAVVTASRERDARVILDYLEQESARLEATFGVTPERRPPIYFYTGSDYPSSTPWHVGQFTGSSIQLSLDPRGSGIARSGMNVLAVHEYIHFLTALGRGGQTPTWLREGLALYFSGQYKSTYESLSDDRKVYYSDRFTPLGEVNISTNSDIGYAESAFIVAYLADTQGEDSLVRLLASLSSGTSPGESLRRIYAVEEDDLVERTREWVRRST